MRKFATIETEYDTSRVKRYKVHGFWSGDAVRAEQFRSFGNLQKWQEPEVCWSCGGRDTEEEPDNLVAAECFAAAILDAVETARKWREESQ